MITLDGIEISPYLLWIDEIWTPVVQREEYFLAGSLEIQTSIRQAGRPITLAAEDENHAWVPRSTVLALMALAAVPGKEMSLVLADGRKFTVVFRHGDGPPVEGVPVVGFSPLSDSDYYNLTLRLLTV